MRNPKSDPASSLDLPESCRALYWALPAPARERAVPLLKRLLAAGASEEELTRALEDRAAHWAAERAPYERAVRPPFDPPFDGRSSDGERS